ncbi:MAG TPA: hypothetical protein VFB67_13650 [Candidatus Polarisedimenticolaceae bacterium]|nr:hypothetical protein [Candidatus Polarisedimenticolaceae bacterium]
MKKTAWAAVGAIGLGLAAWGAARTLLAAPPDEQRYVKRTILVQSDRPGSVENPDRYPGWRSISRDFGLLVREDERFGLRGTFYVRMDEKWRPVAADDIDTLGAYPLR